MPHRIGCALIVLLGLACASPAAWAGKVGPEFQVNTFTQASQFAPAVAALNGGGFVVTWTSRAQDGSGTGVYGQRFRANGSRIGHEFRVNNYKLGDQSNFSVAALTDGGFVVTWNSVGQDGSGYGVYGQRYSGTGERAGRQFRINTRTAHHQFGPSVAGLSGGGFVVVWNQRAFVVYGQRFDAAGSRIGDEFRMTMGTFQGLPVVTGLSDSGFVAIWVRFITNNNEDIYGQRYNAADTKVGREFKVNPKTGKDQFAPSVTTLNDGGFVVTWLSDNGFFFDLYGQRYTAAGVRDGEDFPVKYDSRSGGSLAALSDGGFVIIWTSRKDGSGEGIYGQRYDAAGARVGGEFRVNTTTVNAQHSPSVAALSNGGFVVTWVSTGQDGSADGIYGQRFEP